MPLAAAVTGDEPVPTWIQESAAATLAMNGIQPRGLAAAAVLHYLLHPLAEVVVTAAVHGRWALDTDPALWSIGLDPTYRSPALVQLRPGGHRVVTDPEQRLRLAHDAYTTTARRIATALPAPERMSSRQRGGLVVDTWAGALARVRGQGPPERVSCCLIYTLPGCHECAGCPRLRTGRPSG